MEGAAASAQTKQLEQQNTRLKEALLRYARHRHTVCMYIQSLFVGACVCVCVCVGIVSIYMYMYQEGIELLT